MKELTYTRYGDYDIPNLELSCHENKPIGKFGRMRKRYLQEHRPVLFNCLLLSETLYHHLREIDEATHHRLDTLMSQLIEAAGVTENLKTATPLKWVGLMNALKAQAEEIILSELIYD